MKLKSFIYKWGTFSFLTFLLYDILWIFADSKNFIWTIQNDTPEIVADLVYCSLFSLTSLFICKLLVKNFSKNIQVTQRRLSQLAWATLLTNAILALICDFVYEGVILQARNSEDFWGNIYIFAFIASFVSLLQLNRHFSHLIVNQYEDYISYKKKALRLQLDPHFLFNSLNVLAELTQRDACKAEEFTLQLAEIYRYMLNCIDKDRVAVKEGLRFAQNYVSVINLRHETNIVLNIDYADIDNDEYLPSLSLQILIENAIKHNPPSKEQLLYISIHKSSDEIIVSNNCITGSSKRKHSKIASQGIGLKNLSERYLLECSKEPKVECNSNTFTVHLPIIRI